MDENSSDALESENHGSSTENNQNEDLAQSVGDVRYEQVTVEVHPQPTVEFLIQERGEGQEATIDYDKKSKTSSQEHLHQSTDGHGEEVINREAINAELDEIFDKAHERIESKGKHPEVEPPTVDPEEGSSSAWSAAEDAEDAEETEDSTPSSIWSSSASGSVTDSKSSETVSSTSQESAQTSKSVAKLDSETEYTEFIQDLTSFIDWKPDVTLNTDVFFDECIFPPGLPILEKVPPPIVCFSLKELTILTPKIEDYLKKRNMKNFFRLILGNMDEGSKKEELIRNNVTFILRSLQCPSIESFVLENVDDGMNLSDGKGDRLTLWEFDLREFLMRHSTKLKRITVRSVRILGTSESQRVNYTKEDESLWPKFDNLEELHVILWEKPFSGSIETKALMRLSNPLVNNYWAHLLGTRVFYGHLKKLVWMSYETIPWGDLFEPVIYSNQDTLETVHILCTGNQCKYEGARTRSGFVSHLILSCAQFASVRRLKSLYLQKSHCFLTHLGLLPPSLEELFLDDINIESKSLIEALGKLHRLKKIRLVNNIPNFESAPDNGLKDSYAFGVNEDSMKAILFHRNLNDVCIWGQRFNQDRKSKEKLQAYVVDEAKPCKSKLSVRFKRVGSFLKNLVTRSKSKVGVMKYPPVQNLNEVLKQIGYVGDDCILIGQNSNLEHLEVAEITK